MTDLCADCEEHVAEKSWDCGDQHAFWTGIRFVMLCDACWTKRDNYDGPDEPDYDAPTLAEQCEAAWKIKHGWR